MMLPFLHSFRSILESVFGDLIYLLPQALFPELEKYHVVDTSGIIVWSLTCIVLGVFLGYSVRGSRQ